MYKKFNERGRLQITLPKKGNEKRGGGGGERESRILEMDKMVVNGRRM